MEKHLAKEGLRVRCLTRPREVYPHEQARAVEDLWVCNLGTLFVPWRGRFRLADQSFLIVVTESDDAQLFGMLAASQRTTEHESFLLLEAAYVSETARGRNLLQRMIALTLVQSVRLDRVPPAIAACTRAADGARGLRDVRDHIGGATAFPEPETNVTNLGVAGLARSIARAAWPESDYSAGSGGFYAQTDRRRRRTELELVVLALGSSNEAGVVADARRLFQRRPTGDEIRREFASGEAAGAVAATTR